MKSLQTRRTSTYTVIYFKRYEFLISFLSLIYTPPSPRPLDGLEKTFIYEILLSASVRWHYECYQTRQTEDPTEILHPRQTNQGGCQGGGVDR